jgi:4'-phosphopantetheinyl transferase
MAVSEVVSSGSALAPIERTPLYLWCAYPEDVLTEAVSQACVSMLSEDERKRWQTFRHERHRREYLTTRILVRTALSHYHPLAPEAWRFQLNSRGKPSIHPDYGMRFNVSNSPGLVVCLISRGPEVGVDTEPYEHKEKIAELANQVFSPLELAQIYALHGSERLDRALSLWTLKEAYIKARGVGLSLGLNQFSFLFGGVGGIRLEPDPYGADHSYRCWRYCLLEHAGHRIALFVESETLPELQLSVAWPLLTPPVRPTTCEEPWFPASVVFDLAGRVCFAPGRAEKYGCD